MKVNWGKGRILYCMNCGGTDFTDMINGQQIKGYACSKCLHSRTTTIEDKSK